MCGYTFRVVRLRARDTVFGMLSFEELRSLVAHCTDPARDSFYRRLYKIAPGEPAMQLRSMNDWVALPLVTKDDLIDTPLAERSYLPVSQLDHLRASSGTSGKLPLFSPRTHVRTMDYRFQYHDFKNAFLGFTVPLMPHWHARFQEAHGRLPRVVSFDPKNAAASIRLAKAAGVDALSVFVYHMPNIVEHMKREGMSDRIRFIEVTGEICSRTQYSYMKESFPNATIVQSYNSSEVEDAHIGMPCRPMDGTEPLAVYHSKSSHYLELVHPETGATVEPALGAEGDLLVTAYPGEPASFPLIRFRIGDTVRIVEERCSHGSWSFTVLGRTEMDFLKIPGGILRADEVARVLKSFPERVSDQYELHCSEEKTPTGPKLKPVLYVEAREGVDMTELARDIAKNLRVAPSFTYSDGVEKGRYVALTCEPFSASTHGKSRRLSTH